MNGKRAVIVDPAAEGNVGHHGDVNAHLLQALRDAGLAAELWDGKVLEGCGYLDPRHWADLGGTLHLAKRCEERMQAALNHPARADQPQPAPPVAAWLMHTALPFQLLGLARLLSQQPAATVLVSLMFAPGETLEGATADPEAEGQARVALSALGQACRRGGHHLEIWCPSQQTLELYEPLLAAAGLEAQGVHGAVVGAGQPVEAAAVAPGTGVLLHWGDLKAGKGRAAALTVVERLLAGAPLPPALAGSRWLFHVHSREPLPEAERQVLLRAEAELGGFQWIQGYVEAEEMQRHLAACSRALLAYDPEAYGQRSSGLLWCYGSARLAIGAPALAVGHGEGWLAREAAALGIGWNVGRNGDWLAALGEAETSSAGFTAYGRAVLGHSFAQQMAQRVTAAILSGD